MLEFHRTAGPRRETVISETSSRPAQEEQLRQGKARTLVLMYVLWRTVHLFLSRSSFMGLKLFLCAYLAISRVKKSRVKCRRGHLRSRLRKRERRNRDNSNGARRTLASYRHPHKGEGPLWWAVVPRRETWGLSVACRPDLLYVCTRNLVTQQEPE